MPTNDSKAPQQRKACALPAVASALAIGLAALAGAAPASAQGGDVIPLTRAAPPPGQELDEPVRQFDEEKLGFKPLAGLSPWPINPADPVGSVPPQEAFKSKPLEWGYLLQDLGAEAEKRFQARDYEGALEFYQALAKAAPSRSYAFSKVCECYAALRKFDEAIKPCKIAVSREGVRVLDYVRFADMTLKGRDELSEQEIKDVDGVIAHVLKEKPDAMPTMTYLKCDVGLKLQDATRLDECTQAFAAASIRDSRIVAYEWNLAVLRKDRAAAEALIEEAAQQGMQHIGVEQMRKATAERFAAYEAQTQAAAAKRRDTYLLGAVGGGLGLMGLVFGLRFLKRRSRRGERSKAAEAEGAVETSTSEASGAEASG